MPITQQQADEALSTLSSKYHIVASGLKIGPSIRPIIITERTLHLMVDINHLFRHGNTLKMISLDDLVNTVEIYRQEHDVRAPQISNGNFILAMLMSNFKIRVSNVLQVKFIAIRNDSE